ncbi:MAG TPA: bifunctional nuclease family protein [Candidatus Omnitrophota bacterium]|nr:bifunctional nuclease family protein [Candidatus Omnitrophota bacterium]
MVRVELVKIIIDEKRQDQVIVLKEKDGERQIPVVIGFMEASSIRLKISGVDMPRPMTHDLLVNVIEVLGGRLERALIDKLVDNTFHAKLEIRSKEGEIKLIDARPSDSIAMAVRLKSPIFVADDIFDKSAMPQPE